MTHASLSTPVCSTNYPLPYAGYRGYLTALLARNIYGGFWDEEGAENLIEAETKAVREMARNCLFGPFFCTKDVFSGDVDYSGTGSSNTEWEYHLNLVYTHNGGLRVYSFEAGYCEATESLDISHQAGEIFAKLGARLPYFKTSRALPA